MTNIDEEAGSFVLRSYGLFFKKQFQDFKSLSNVQTLDENKTFSPIKIGRQSVELLPLTDLVSSDNILMTKVISVLTSLCVEVIELKQEAYTKHFHFISIYDEYSDDDVCKQMAAICSLTSFISRCDDTLYNLCGQVFAVYSKGIVNLGGFQLHFVINHIGELFSILVLIELLISNSCLAAKWNTYCQSLQSSYQSKENLNITASKFQSILEATENITLKIMDDNIVQNCLNHIVTLRKSLIDKSCNSVSTEFSQYIKQAIWNMDKLIQEKPTVHNMQKCIKINALFVLSFHLFGYNDKKTFKALMELNSKAHSIHVSGTTIWFPEQFLQRYAQSLCLSNSRFSQTMVKARQSYISSKRVCIIREIQTYQSVSVQFILDLEHYFSKSSELNAADMSTIAKTLLEGLDLASQINYSALSLINLHLTLGIPLSKTMLMSLFDMIDILKSIKESINRNHDKILSSINMITQHLLFQGITSILEVKKSLMTDKNYENKRLDELTCLVIAERAIKGALTVKRSVAAHIALSFVPETTYLEDSYTKLGLLLEKNYSLNNFIEFMNVYCNCSWIFWHQNVMQIYLQQNFNNQLNVIKIKYFFMVIDDIAKLLHTTDVYYGKKKLQSFLTGTENMVESNILKNTSQNIETNLRLHIHSHLQLDVISPYSKEMTKKAMLAIDIFRLCTIYLSIIPSVEHYLSTMFYNLTTVVLSDWKTYGEMRQMAKFKFNLSTVEDNLPTQTLEQGLDVLEIMRNIHIFVSKYLYNLNNQIFIEKSSNNKHLNSINIRHIANSIRTHGTGIMNTTVNFTYQFLKKKFYTLSQFMYDEHIKSRLFKDLRLFKESMELNKNMYPYKSAERFNKGIKVLGLDEDGQSYLDLFRDLISQIGNAMGYVRMIRSGGRHCCSDATVFLPSHETLSSFKQLSQEYNGEKTGESAENLDQNIDVLMSNFIQGTEYFKLLVDVFSPVFRNPKNVHLKNFYVIVPPLTLNFVDHMILSKDKMSKKNKIGAAFTDDGFAMGIAYILKLLDQDTNFESLHWFDSVWAHITEARRSIDEQKKRGPVQLQQTLALTEKKLKSLEDEYKLLYYSLTSARIFFR